MKRWLSLTVLLLVLILCATLILCQRDYNKNNNNNSGNKADSSKDKDTKSTYSTDSEDEFLMDEGDPVEVDDDTPPEYSPYNYYTNLLDKDLKFLKHYGQMCKNGKEKYADLAKAYANNLASHAANLYKYRNYAPASQRAYIVRVYEYSKRVVEVAKVKNWDGYLYYVDITTEYFRKVVVAEQISTVYPQSYGVAYPNYGYGYGSGYAPGYGYVNNAYGGYGYPGYGAGYGGYGGYPVAAAGYGAAYPAAAGGYAPNYAAAANLAANPYVQNIISPGGNQYAAPLVKVDQPNSNSANNNANNNNNVNKPTTTTTVTPTSNTAAPKPEDPKQNDNSSKAPSMNNTDAKVEAYMDDSHMATVGDENPFTFEALVQVI
ncbi:hypothetical protein ABK040_001931 [Willaertia magna]